MTSGVDTIFHLAALIAIPYSYVAPESYVDTNVTGTLNMCQAAKDHGVGRLVVDLNLGGLRDRAVCPYRRIASPAAAVALLGHKIGADAIAKSFSMHSGCRWS